MPTSENYILADPASAGVRITAEDGTPITSDENTATINISNIAQAGPALKPYSKAPGLTPDER